MPATRRLPDCASFLASCVPLLSCCLALSISCFGAGIELNSPDGNIRVSFELTDRLPRYSVFYKGLKLIDASPLDLRFKEPGSDRGVSFFGKGLLIHGVNR